MFTRELPEWNAEGIKPPQSRIDEGWQEGIKPPAQWFNWYQHTTYKALEEMRNALENFESGPSNAAELDFDGTGAKSTKQAVDDVQQEVTEHQADTIQHVTFIPRMLSDDPGTDYPVGISIHEVISATNEGYPLQLGVVFSYKVSNLRFTQFMYSHAQPLTFTRVWYNGAWSNWIQLESTEVAQARHKVLENTVTAHQADKANPHNVTAAQVGAVNKAGDAMSGRLDLTGYTEQIFETNLNFAFRPDNYTTLVWNPDMNRSIRVSENTTYSNDSTTCFNVILNQTATPRTITWNIDGLKWKDGEIPDVSGANKTYVLTFVTYDQGVTWLGFLAGEF